MAIEATPGRIKTARVLAVVADALQWGLLPLFFEGLLSPVNDALDVAVGIAMVALLGWHWAFLPAFVSELVPLWALAPTWTIAVVLATRGAMSPSDDNALPGVTREPKALPPGRHRGAS
jgi:hypothetical protein